jgi:hypothetical protein
MHEQHRKIQISAMKTGLFILTLNIFPKRVGLSRFPQHITLRSGVVVMPHNGTCVLLFNIQ